MGRGGEGCAGRTSRAEEEEEEDSFFLLSSLEPTERALTEASLGLSLGLSSWFSLGLFFPFAISYLGTRLTSWLLPFDGTRDPELSVSKRDSTGGSLVAQNTWERRFKQRSERGERGREKISTDSVSPDHRFLFLFWLDKVSIFLFFILFWHLD